MRAQRLGSSVGGGDIGGAGKLEGLEQGALNRIALQLQGKRAWALRERERRLHPDAIPPAEGRAVRKDIIVARGAERDASARVGAELYRCPRWGRHQNIDAVAAGSGRDDIPF
jgi:hypothetical protein